MINPIDAAAACANIYIRVKFSRIVSIGLRRKGSYAPDITKDNIEEANELLVL